MPRTAWLPPLALAALLALLAPGRASAQAIVVSPPAAPCYGPPALYAPAPAVSYYAVPAVASYATPAVSYYAAPSVSTTSPRRPRRQPATACSAARGPASPATTPRLRRPVR